MNKEKIGIGEYVRTKNGEIGKFKGYNNNPKSQWNCKLEFQKVKTWKYCCEEYILKHSKNIIDLIEVGDYINGRIVISVLDEFAEGTMEVTLLDKTKIYRNYNKDIKSIVTKELYKEMEYKI